MSLSVALALAALAASIYLVMQGHRTWAMASAVASGLQLAMAFGWISVRIANVPLPLVLAIVLAGCGGFLFTRVGSKGAVASATVIALVGALGLVRAFG